MLVILKLALSLNGFLDEGLSQRSILSNTEDRSVVSKLRSKVDAIVIGGGTFRNDNPSLLVYSKEDQKLRILAHRSPHPLPVILWGAKNSPQDYLDSKLFIEHSEHTRPVLLIAAKSLKPEMENLPSHILREYHNEDRISVNELINLLQLQGIGHVLVEGSGPLTTLLLESRTPDIIRIAYRGKLFNPETAKRITPTGLIDLTEDYLLERLEKVEGTGNDSMYAAWYVKKGLSVRDISVFV